MTGAARGTWTRPSPRGWQGWAACWADMLVGLAVGLTVGLSWRAAGTLPRVARVCLSGPLGQGSM